MNQELRNLYYSYFDVHADVGADQHLVAEALRLRYQVYCVEHAYEDPTTFPDEMERDAYDDRSLHSLLTHRASGLVAGTVRLIRADPSEPMGSLPIDQLCHEAELRDDRVVPRASVVEVSRFAISRDFRRRVGDAKSPTGVGPDWDERHLMGKRRLPHLSVGLVAAMVHNSHDHGLTHWVAEMEPALLRMYSRLGVHWINIGPLIEFRGKRQPCYTVLGPMLERTQQERPDIWDLITNGGEWTCRAGDSG